MKTTIYKYPLEVTDVQDIKVPSGSIILSLQSQNDIPCLWIFIPDTEAEKVKIRLMTFGTGVPIDYQFDPDRFIGTYQLRNGSFVGHVFAIDFSLKQRI